MRKLLILLIAAALVCACGQKGPLYLPDKEQPKKDRLQR
jgi:predicted small lipoprotein YifL